MSSIGNNQGLVSMMDSKIIDQSHIAKPSVSGKPVGNEAADERKTEFYDDFKYE